MRSLIPPNHYRVIAAHVPDVTADEIEMNIAGNDHVVYFVRRQTTFRFPRTPRRLSPTWKRFLDAFVPLSPVPVPLITIHHDERTGSDYEVNTYLPGVPFEPSLARSLFPEGRCAIASELGEFLTALHRFPLATARAVGTDELDLATFGAHMEENLQAYPYFRRTVFPCLIAQQRQWVERLFGDYIAHVKAHPFPVCVTHADVWTFHILIDPRKGKTHRRTRLLAAYR
ncbi:MAG TPA: aminoglycoside phosphotransferase family protein [Ktedonobacterales bacterium]